MKDIEFYEIDGLHFTTQQFGFKIGNRLFWELLKLCGKSLAALLFEGVAGFLAEVSGGKISKEEAAKMDVMELLKKLDPSRVVEALDFFIQNIDPEAMLNDEGTGLQQRILQTTWIVDDKKDRRSIDWDIDFKGRYGTAIKLLKHVLILQYASSFQNVLSGTAATSKTEMKVVGKPVVAR